MMLVTAITKPFALENVRAGLECLDVTGPPIDTVTPIDSVVPIDTVVLVGTGARGAGAL
ncbi:MAG TPA: hypothetical protein VGN22_07515 [Pseudonocardia sp.]